MPRVSVVMNCRNAERFLVEAIESVHAQTYDDWEIVFWDNVSTDRSGEIAGRYPRLRYHRGNEMLPLGRARNAAVGQARGSVLAFLDCDDAWLPDFLENAVRRIDAHPRIGLVYTDAHTMDETGAPGLTYWRRFPCAPSRGDVLADLMFRNPILLSAVAFRREAFDGAGGFSDYEFAEDYDLWLRMAAHWSFDYDPLPLARYRVHPGSLTSQMRELPFIECLQIYERWASDPSASIETRRAATAAVARMRWRYAAWLAGTGERARALEQVATLGGTNGGGLARCAELACLPGAASVTLGALRVLDRHRDFARRLSERWHGMARRDRAPQGRKDPRGTGRGARETSRAILIAAPTRPLAVDREATSLRWAYLGPSVCKRVGLQARWGSEREIRLASAAQATARSLVDEYVRYIAEWGKAAGDDELWWLEGVAEKNPYVSKTFQWLVWSEAVTEAVRRVGSDVERIVLLAEPEALRADIAARVQDLGGWRVERSELPGLRFGSAVAAAIEFVGRRGYFVLVHTYQWVLATLIYRMQSAPPLRRSLAAGRPLSAVYTWIDPRSFDARGQLRDSYFGDLHRYLADAGDFPVLVPMVLRTIPYRKALMRLRRLDHPVLVPHAALSPADIFWLTLGSVRPPALPRPIPKFRGHDISGLVLADSRTYWVRANAAAAAQVLGRAAARWREAGINFARAIYPFENHAWERGLTMAWRRASPTTRLVGFQHPRPARLLLSYHLGPGEDRRAPLPDRIVTSGELATRQLAAWGLPSDRLLTGGAIRQADLLRRTAGLMAQPRASTTPPKVLLAMPIGLDEAAEALMISLEAFAGRPQYRLVVRCHPSNPLPKVLGALGISELPSGTVEGAGDLADLLSCSDVVVYTTSTASLEAVASGVPVVHLETLSTLDMDALEQEPGARPTVASADELRFAVASIVADRERFVRERWPVWQRLVAGYFAPVVQETYRAFRL